MRIETKMIALMATTLLVAGSAVQAVQIYSADFSTDGIGWSHVTSSPAPSAPASNSVSNFTIGYTSNPSSDTTANTFITSGGSLNSTDWGGAAYFTSDPIDVSAYDIADIAFTGTGLWGGSASEFVTIRYTLDAGSPVETTFATTFTNPSFDNVDVSGANSLTIGFDFNMNGSSDSFSFSAITVDAETTGGPPSSSEVLFMETFETDGEGTRYTVGPQSGSDGDEDYWDRVSNATTDRSYTGMEGTWYFGGQDVDDAAAAGTTPATLLIEDIDISGYENLEFSGLFAEQRPEDAGADDIDSTDYAHIEYQIDGGGWQNLLWFENDGSSSNTTFLEDTDFDGTGDGDQLETAFAEFVKSIVGTGSLLDLRFTVSVNAGDEDFAFDNLKITGTAIGGSPVPAPAALPAGLAMLGLVMGRRRRR